MSQPDTTVVLAVDDDEKLLETYEMWLGAAYELRTAASGEAALELLDADVDVVLLDRLMPGMSGEEVLERIRERDVDCRVAMVTAVEPDFDIVDMPFDDYVSKALTRETVVETVERLAALDTYDDLQQQHYRLAEKLAAIEQQKSATELADNEVYQRLCERFDRLDEHLDEQGAVLDRDDVVRSLETLEDHTDTEQEENL